MNTNGPASDHHQQEKSSNKNNNHQPRRETSIRITSSSDNSCNSNNRSRNNSFSNNGKLVNGSTTVASIKTDTSAILQQPASTSTASGSFKSDDESYCCKLSYTDYTSIDCRDLAHNISSTSNLQSPQLHANCHTGKLAEKLFEEEDESDFCASCASHPKINLVLYCFGYIGFMIFASCIFTMTEREVEKEYRNDLTMVQMKFLRDNPQVSVESLNDLLKQVTQYHAKKINWEPLDPDIMSFKRSSSADGDMERRSDTLSQHSKSNNNSIKGSLDAAEVQGVYNWEFTSSLLFVTSLVTTIGYGHVSPLTQFGKVLAIIFSTIGIPLTLTLLSTLSSLLLRSPIRRFETSLAIVATRLTSKANVLMVRLSHLAIITMLFLIICFFLPAYIFHRMEEGWTYLDSIYYCYISLTTIGLGDFVPASTITNDTDLTYYRIGTVLYLYFGLTLIVLWLALVYRIPQLNLNQILLSTETDNKLKQRETLRILNTCSRVQETPSTSRSSLSKSYGTQNVATPTTP